MKNADMPAMPVSVAKGHDGDVVASYDFAGGMGLTKREYFAAMALQGFLSGPLADSDCELSGLAHDSLIAADALLEALDND